MSAEPHYELSLDLPAVLAQPSFIRHVDIDGDGDPDVITGDEGSNELQIFWGGH